MAIEIQKSPPTWNWSGNPIHYQLYSSVAQAEPTAYFEVKIKFKRTDEGSYSDIIILPYYPVNGVAKIDINHVLHGLLEYEVPGIPDDNEYSSPLFSRKITGQFYIAYREITSATPDPAFTDSAPVNPLNVIKGGISYEKWRGDNYWVNYFFESLPFLTWQRSGRMASLTERMYLAWLNTTDVPVGDIKMRRKVVYYDGTIAIAELNCPINKYEVVYFPTGSEQLVLEDIFPDKKIRYWEMQVWDKENQVPLSEAYRYEVDNRYDSNDTTFNYRNSLGGLDSVRMRGDIDDQAERSFVEQDSIVLHNYFEGAFILPKIKIADSSELIVSKANTGFLNKEELDRLREIHFIRECWWAQDGKWLPITIRTGSGKLRSTSDDLWSLPIEYSLAHSGDNYYTPRSVNLAEGGFTSPNLCSAVISVLASSFAELWQVSWSLISGSPIRYEVSTPGVSGGAPTYTTDTSHIFPWLPLGTNVITVRPVCKIGEEYHYGAAQTIEIENGEVCTPVGIVGTPLMPKAIKDIAYSYEFDLSGSAPFVLSDIIKPSWMTIEISGSKVVFSGTPTVASAAATVSFVVKNCSNANSVSFSGSVAVLTPATGVIHAENHLSVGSILAILPADWYSFNTGDLPITPSGALSGIHTGTTDQIGVTIDTHLTGHVSLYIDGVIIQTLAVNGTDTYYFDAVTIGESAQVLIILTP